MILLSFARWSTAKGPMWPVPRSIYFLRKRLYWGGWRWTPFVRVTRSTAETPAAALMNESWRPRRHG